MGVEIEFLLKFDESVVRKTHCEDLEDILLRPVSVKKGQVIARELEMGTVHEDGRKGVRYRPPAGKGLRDTLRENLSVARDNSSNAVSMIDGYLCARGDVLTVTKIMEVFGDVGPGTGDILSGSSVRVHGGVGHNQKVEAAGDIEVLGLVETGFVKATGNIALKGGVAGGDVGLVSAGKDLYVSFIQNGRLEAQGSIVVDGPVMNAELTAGKKIQVRGKGFIVGGVVRAMEEISVSRVGSESGLPTEIRLGYNPFEARQKEDQASRTERLQHFLEEKTKDVAFACQSLASKIVCHPNDPLSDIFHLSDMLRSGATEGYGEEETEMFTMLGASLMAVVHTREELSTAPSAGQEEAPAAARVCKTASLKVEREAHPGVHIFILDQGLLLDVEYDRVRFILKDGTVQAATY